MRYILARVEFKKTNAKGRTFLLAKDAPVTAEPEQLMREAADKMKVDIEKQEFLTLMQVHDAALKEQPHRVSPRNLQTVATSGIESIEYLVVDAA